MMKKLWKPLILIFVVGVMAVDLFLDFRSGQDQASLLAATGDETTAVTQPDLPVGTAAGELAPDFVGRTLDGIPVRLSGLRGKTVLVNVFASWCAPCRLEAPHLVDVSKSVGDEVVFIGLNLQETPEAVELFREEFGIEFPLVLNEDGTLTEIYQPIGLPTSWFIDAQGVVQYVHTGPVTQDFLARAIEDVQAGRTPDPFAGT